MRIPNSVSNTQDWIMDQWEKSFYITAIAGALNGSSLVLMSKGLWLMILYQSGLPLKFVFCGNIFVDDKEKTKCFVCTYLAWYLP